MHGIIYSCLEMFKCGNRAQLQILNIENITSVFQMKTFSLIFGLLTLIQTPYFDNIRFFNT